MERLRVFKFLEYIVLYFFSPENMVAILLVLEIDKINKTMQSHKANLIDRRTIFE